MKKSPKTPKNKVFLSLGLIAASSIYALSQYVGHAPAAAASTPSQAIHLATAQPKSGRGTYIDGTYTGSAVNAYYGTLQVKAVVTSGKLADVQFLQYANDRGTSVAINTGAMPILKSEAIQAQGFKVNIVSGATFTSQAFEQSLQSALVQAQA